MNDEATVKFYKGDKGFGFITKADGNDLFFHITDWKNQAEPQQDDRVTFEESISDRTNKPIAVNVTLLQ